MEWYERAKRLIEERKVDREHLRQHLSVEESTLRSYLNGTRTPSIFKLAKLADFLQVSLDELMGRTRYVEPPLPGAVAEPASEYLRYRILRENFDSLTERQQEHYLRELQDAKQKNEELLSELLARRHSA